MCDPIFLQILSTPVTPDDLQVATDLLDTLTHHKNSCVGMAANIIGVSKRIIAVDNEGEYLVMLNPKLIKTAQPYQTEEGCLSLWCPPHQAVSEHQSGVPEREIPD